MAQVGSFTAKKTGSTLTVKIELDANGRPSASGKSTVHATTSGFMPVDGGYGLSFNVTKPKS